MIKKASIVFGILFIVTGITGFFPNPIIGEDSVFHADLVHNIVHLALGVILVLGACKTDETARKTMRAVSVTYMAIAIIGFVQFGGKDDSGKLLGLVGVNSADNWLHLFLALAIYFGMRIAGRNTESPAPTAL